MNFLQKALIVGALGAVCLPVIVNAQAEVRPDLPPPPPAPMGGRIDLPPPPHVEVFFKDADANRDKSVSKEEYKALGEKIFSEADTNKDDKLTIDEWRAHHLAKVSGAPCDAKRPPQ